MFKLPSQVEYIITELLSKGYAAHIVGGCVRDCLLNQNPNDWDICTSATPYEILKTFEKEKTILTGVKHGTVTIVLDSNQYEVTTYRIDGEYEDSRHPQSVTFTKNLHEDLKRRDFTINSLAYNHEDGLIDIFGGIEDMRYKIIKCVGDAEERLSEDSLRIMRAIRFAIKYGFYLHSDTENAMRKLSLLLINISKERITSELIKILQCDLSNKQRLLMLLIELLSSVVPNLKHVNSCLVSKRLSESTPILEVRLALLFDFDLETANKILKELKFPNKTIKTTLEIIKYGNQLLEYTEKRFGIKTTLTVEENYKSSYFEQKLLHDTGYENAVMSLEYAYSKIEKGSYQELMLDIYGARIGDCYYNGKVYNVSQLEVNGNDLIEIGLRGTEIGNTLNWLLSKVMMGQIKNEKESLEKEASKKLLFFKETRKDRRFYD